MKDKKIRYIFALINVNLFIYFLKTTIYIFLINLNDNDEFAFKYHNYTLKVMY